MQKETYKNILLAVFTFIILVLVTYTYTYQIDKVDMVTQSENAIITSNKTDKYALGYTEDDMNGTKSIITKRVGDFYCKETSHYDVVTKEPYETGSFACAHIDGTIIYSAGGVVDCKMVLNKNAPRDLEVSLDHCF